jgi:hypothetical protein
MSQQPSDSNQSAQGKPKLPCHQDKRWLCLSYSIARDQIIKLPLAECTPVSWDIPRAVELVLERVEVLMHDESFKPIWTPPKHHLQLSRLYMGALGHLDRLHRHAQQPALKGEALWQRAVEVRGALRKIVDDLDNDGYIIEELELPRRQGNSARSVGKEVLVLLRFCDSFRMCLEDRVPDLCGLMSDARLQAERLLTAIGDRDAPSEDRQLRREHLQTSEAFMREWRGVRVLLREHGCDEHEVERLALAL